MGSIILVLVVLLQFSVEGCYSLKRFNVTGAFQFPHHALNRTIHIAKTGKASLFNGTTTLANFTFTVPACARNISGSSPNRGDEEETQVDCFGLGKTVATVLETIFRSKPNGSQALDVRFSMSSRKQPRRVHIVLGEQFGLEWTDFKIERRTVIIVHGFLSHGEETWVSNLENALLEWVSCRMLSS